MPISEADETTILVRKGLRIAGRHKLVMRKDWIGPKARRWHKPREYKWAGVWKGGIRWKVLSVHIPFGEGAQAESAERIVQWLNNHHGAAIAAGDFNKIAAWVREHIAKPAGAKVKGFRIDLGVWKGCRLVEAKQLGKHGSDHHAVLFIFERRNALGRLIRLTLLVWNVEVGHDNAAVSATVIELSERYDVDVVLLSETYGKSFAAPRRLGWRVIQRLRNAAKRKKGKR